MENNSNKFRIRYFPVSSSGISYIDCGSYQYNILTFGAFCDAEGNEMDGSEPALTTIESGKNQAFQELINKNILIRQIGQDHNIRHSKPMYFYPTAIGLGKPISSPVGYWVAVVEWQR